jgi:hypothetical protein
MGWGQMTKGAPHVQCSRMHQYSVALCVHEGEGGIMQPEREAAVGKVARISLKKKEREK